MQGAGRDRGLNKPAGTSIGAVRLVLKSAAVSSCDTNVTCRDELAWSHASGALLVGRCVQHQSATEERHGRLSWTSSPGWDSLRALWHAVQA
eukprot:scaffold247441_cov34-Tisochrysis_lutea.AAC.3